MQDRGNYEDNEIDDDNDDDDDDTQLQHEVHIAFGPQSCMQTGADIICRPKSIVGLGEVAITLRKTFQTCSHDKRPLPV